MAFIEQQAVWVVYMHVTILRHSTRCYESNANALCFFFASRQNKRGAVDLARHIRG